MYILFLFLRILVLVLALFFCVCIFYSCSCVCIFYFCSSQKKKKKKKIINSVGTNITSKLKILQIIMWNIGMAQKAKETRSGCLVHIVQ